MFHLLLPSLTPLLRGHPADPLSYCITRLFLMIRPPQRSTLFPYTTLFRSLRVSGIVMRLRMFLLLITFLKASHSFRNRLQEGDKQEKHRSEERFSRNAETDLVCRLLLEKKKNDALDESELHAARRQHAQCTC